jgi:hypothetical protein
MICSPGIGAKGSKRRERVCARSLDARTLGAAVNRIDRPPTFQHVAQLVAGPHPPPPWLARHLEWWTSSLRVAQMIEKHRPTKVLMKKKLDEIKSAALLLERTLSDTHTRKFLELAPSGQIKNVHAHDLRDLAKRLIPLAQVRLYVVGAARGTGRRVCEGCLA